MPATRPTTIHQRQDILRWAEAGMTTKAIAQQLQIAPRTVRKWRQRAGSSGLAALVTQLGRPHSGPLAKWPALVRYLALRLKLKHSGWGATYIVKKIGEYPNLKAQPLPNPSTVWRYWRSFGDRLLARQPTPEPGPPPCGEVHGVWQLDFKESLLIDGLGATTITHARDQVGRATVCHRIHTAPEPETRILKLTTAQVQADCRIAFTQWGMPDAIRTDRASLFHDDNPHPFPTRLSLWWVGLDIQPQRIRRGLPQDNGGVERAHRTADERTFQGQHFSSPAELQRQLDADWHELNFECPSRARDCHGQPPVVAHPELLQARRMYRPEWEAGLFDLARVRQYLVGKSWVRTVSGRGQVSLGSNSYSVSFAWRHLSVKIHFDPEQHAFVFTPILPAAGGGSAPTDVEPRHRAAKGLSPAELMGPIDLTLEQPTRQLCLPLALFAAQPQPTAA